MTKRESFLLKVLGIVIILAGTFLSITYWREKNHIISSQKEQYINAIKRLSAKDIKNENTINEIFKFSTPEEASKYFFAELEKFDIIPEKYQILGNNNIEISLNVNSDQLISFLFEGKNDDYIPYQIDSMNIKNINGRLQVNIQIKPIFSKTASMSFSKQERFRVNKLFEEEKINRDIPISIKKEKTLVNALSVFDYVGKAENEDGNQLLVLKNKDSGRVIKVYINKITDNSYYFSHNHTEYELKIKDLL